MTAQVWAVGAVWALTLLAGVVVAVALSRAAALPGLALVLAGAVVAAFVLQMAGGQRAGFVDRLTASVAGAFGIVLAVAAVVALV